MAKTTPLKAERHISIPHRLLNSPAYLGLSNRAKVLFQDLRMKYNGHNNGNISASLSDLRKRGWNSSSTLAKCLRELQEHGFLDKTRQGGIAYMSKLCNLFRFTDLDVFETPGLGLAKMAATNDFETFIPKPAPEKKSKVRKSKLSRSKPEAMGPVIGSNSEAEIRSYVRNSKL